MADMDDQTTLRLRVVYEANQAIGQAISEIRRLKEETGGLSAENQKTLIQLEYQKTLLDGAGSSLDHYTELVHEEALAQRAIRQALEESTTTHDVTATKVVTTAEAHKGLGRGVLQASYAFQDFTSVIQNGGGFSRALGSVQNNIPVLLSSLGVGAGLAGTISLVSVGVGAAIPLLMQFADAEDKAAEATKKHAEEAEKLRGVLTNKEEAIKKEVLGYLKETGGDIVPDAINAAMAQEARHKPIGDEELGPVLAELPAVFGEQPGVREKRARETVIRRREEKAKEDANRLISTLATDPSSRAEAARLARSHGGFPGDFAESMDTASRGGAIAPDTLFDQSVKQYDDVLAQTEESSKAKKAKQAEIKHQAEQRFAEEQRKEREAETEKRHQETEKKRQQAETKHQAEQRFQEEQRIEREQKQAEEKAARDATKAARDADPRIANRRAMQDDQSQALGLVNQNTHGFTPEIQRQIAHHLQSNHQAGLDMSATFAQALDYAIRQTREDIQRGIASGMRRQHQTSQSFYQP